MRFLILSLLAIAMSTATASAQAVVDQWERLGTIDIDRNAERTALAFSTNDKRTFGVKIRVAKGRLDLRGIVVSFGNGQQHREELSAVLATGKETGAIDERDLLQGGLVIEAVDVTHAKSLGATTIEIWGLIKPRRGPSASRTVAATSEQTGYTEVEVLYGTSRRRESDRAKNGRALATFGSADGNALTRGRALVTVPKKGRTLGEIPRPDVDLWLFRFNWRAEDPKRDFTIAAVDVLQPGEFSRRVDTKAAAAKNFRRQAFVFIHGYNVSFEDAVFRTAQITADIGYDGVPVLFSWQSKAGGIAYPHDQAVVGEAKAHLFTLLRELAASGNLDRVNIIAHSMGNEVLLRALSEETRGAGASGVSAGGLKLGEIILAAPDVDRAAFERIAPRIRSLATGVTLYASSSDKALQASARFVSGRPRAGDVPATTGPVIVPGVDTIDVSDASTNFLALHHTDFAERVHLLRDILVLFQKPVRPPDARSNYLFAPVKRNDAIYWRYLRN